MENEFNKYAVETTLCSLMTTTIHNFKLIKDFSVEIDPNEGLHHLNHILNDSPLRMCLRYEDTEPIFVTNKHKFNKDNDEIEIEYIDFDTTRLDPERIKLFKASYKVSYDEITHRKCMYFIVINKAIGEIGCTLEINQCIDEYDKSIEHIYFKYCTHKLGTINGVNIISKIIEYFDDTYLKTLKIENVGVMKPIDIENDDNEEDIEE